MKAKLREDRQRAVRPNEVWAMDFLHDQLATGHKIRVLTEVDTFSRFSPALNARLIPSPDEADSRGDSHSG